MTGAYWHLVLNHIPVFGILFGIIIYSIGLFRKQTSFQNGGYVIFMLTALLTIPAYYTGEPAEHLVEKISDVPHHVIHEHEEVAETAFIMSNVLGILSLFSLMLTVKRPEKVSVFTRAMTLILALFTLIMMLYTAYEGGKIRRPELQDSRPNPSFKPNDIKVI